MLKLFKPGGAISVFLVIILVPCLVISFLYVDASRIYLSRSAVESTADMTLNSLMANYDVDLNEYYGLVASVQNIGEFYDASEEFFTKSLTANGISEDQSNEIVSWIFNEIKGGGDFTDLLQAGLVDDSVNIYSEEGSGLGENSVLIQEGVVEFMKYRSAQIAVESFMDKLKSSDDAQTLQNDLKNAAEDSELAKSRDEFADAEGELNKREFYTYYYYQQYKALNPTYDKLEEIKDETDKITGVSGDHDAIYDSVTLQSVQSLWITESDAPSLSADTININSPSVDTKSCIVTGEIITNSSYTASDVCTEEDTEDGETSYYITWDKVTEALNNVTTKKTALETRLSEGDAAIAAYKDCNYGSNDDQTNMSQWYYFARNAITSSRTNINKAASELADAYNKLRTIYTFCDADPDDTEFDTNWKTSGTSHTNIESAIEASKIIFSTAFKGDNTPVDTKAGHDYCTVRNKLASISTQARNSYSRSSAGASIVDVATKLSNNRKTLQDYYDAINIVIEGDGDEVVSLEDLKDLVYIYEGELAEWTAKADESTTTLGGTQREEAETYQNTRSVDTDDIDEFKRKLVEVRDIYGKAIDCIDALKFGDSKLIDITDYSKYYAEFEKYFTKPAAPMTNSEMKQTATDIMNRAFQPSHTESLMPLSDFGLTKSTKLKLEAADDAYYKFMSEKGYGDNLDDTKSKVEEKDGKLDDFKGQKEDAENKENNTEQNGSDVTYGKDVNVDKYSGSDFGDVDIILGLAETIENLLSGNGVEVRDSLYCTLYATRMFSYRTFVYEGKYEMLGGNYGGSEINLNNYKNAYASKNTDWTTVDPANNTLNISLTNKAINAENNAANNAELEYILYGGTNEENIKSAYWSIYGVRYALNLASGFVNFYSSTLLKDEDNVTKLAIYAVSRAIQIATKGIIPIPVTECILIALLTALESIHDMSALTKGLPVEL